MTLFKAGDLFRRTKPYDACVLDPHLHQKSPKELANLVTFSDRFFIQPTEILVYVSGEFCLPSVGSMGTEHIDVVFLHPHRGVCFMSGVSVEFLELVES